MASPRLRCTSAEGAREVVPVHREAHVHALFPRRAGDDHVDLDAGLGERLQQPVQPCRAHRAGRCGDLGLVAIEGDAGTTGASTAGILLADQGARPGRKLDSTRSFTP
jgi:hypothetical protein